MYVDLPLVWFDAEFSGLNEQNERVLEFACVITDKDLNPLDSLGPIVIHQSDDLLKNMNDWNTNTHTASGLVDRVRNSTCTESDAESLLLSFISKHCAKKEAPLAGNSIHSDLKFLAKYFPAVHDYLHYRILDVSTIKEIVVRRYPSLPKFVKKNKHRALDDVFNSIDELKYYYQHIFR
ncbi:hypothetical protein GEMRC1_009156 [Eukaryota sp. GEM-RC1]